MTGYWFFHQSQWRPPEALSEYLAAGPKPVYIGFGSMVSSNATSFTETVLAAVKKSGQRAVLASGWGGLAGDEGAQSEQIFFLRHAPHDWLFPRMSAAVHHGGAGTTSWTDAANWDTDSLPGPADDGGRVYDGHPDVQGGVG